MSDDHQSISANSGKDEEVHVVLEQTILKDEEVFVYRIPPMMTSGGHHAENWNLATPLATCSLHVIQRDNDLLIQLMTDRPKVGGPPGSTEQHLFAQCHIQLDVSIDSSKRTKPMEFWVEKVTDSSRYFVIRISDAQTGREAFIGIGFRERTDATNFKMSLQEYENSLRNEQKAHASHLAYEKEHQHLDTTGYQTNDTSEAKSTNDSFSKLSLKEGQKIHIKIKGVESNSRLPKPTKEKPGPALSSKGGLPLLRKPPTTTTLKIPLPPTHDVDTVAKSKCQSPIMIDTQDLIENSEDSHCSSVKSTDVSSSVAVAELDEVNDDEWGDFESSN